MRKVNLTVTARVMVPVIIKYTAVVKVNEGVSMDNVAKTIVSGTVPDTMDVDDSSFEIVGVEDKSSPQGVDDIDDLSDQVTAYIEGEEGVTPTVISHNVGDSR